MKARKLLIVLQEDDARMIKQLGNNPTKLQKYRYYIRHTNALLIKLIPLYWSACEYEFKSFSECKSLSSISKEYFTLDFASIRENENTELYRLAFDTVSYSSNRAHLIANREYGFFQIRLIERFETYITFTWYTPSSLPNEFDFTIAIQQINHLIKAYFNGLKNEYYEASIRERNKKLFLKTLLADSMQINKQMKSYKYIDSLYIAPHKIVGLADLMRALQNKDSSSAILFVIPYKDAISRGFSYSGTSGGGMNEYEKIFYFMQLIMDTHTGELLYYDSSEDSRIVVRDWKRFLRFADENKFLIPLPNTNKENTETK